MSNDGRDGKPHHGDGQMHGNGNGLRPIEILMVEDSAPDVLLTREALTDAKVRNRLHVVEDGLLAMAFLRRRPPFQDAPRPDLVLLDLNLPKMDGREVLVEIKGDDELKTIPVVVLTTSKAEEDILRAYRAHANCFIRKPVDFAKFSDVVRVVENFWFTVVSLPPAEKLTHAR